MKPLWVAADPIIANVPVPRGGKTVFYHLSYCLFIMKGPLGYLPPLWCINVEPISQMTNDYKIIRPQMEWK